MYVSCFVCVCVCSILLLIPALRSLSLPTCGYLLPSLNHRFLPTSTCLLPRLLFLSLHMLHCCLSTTLLLLSLLNSFLPRSSRLPLPPQFGFFIWSPSHCLYIDLYIPSLVLYSDRCLVSKYAVPLISASDSAATPLLLAAWLSTSGAALTLGWSGILGLSSLSV